jgi:hypothetical protein
MLRWDPIGVAGAPSARDEYDSYLGLVADRLRTHASVDDTASLLESIRTKQMGLRPYRSRDTQAARLVSEWYDAEMAGWARSR